MVVTALAVAGLFSGAQFAHAVLTPQQEFGALGTAWNFDVLTYVTPNNSSAHFNGGMLGVVNGQWSESGGDNAQQNMTIVVNSHANQVMNGGGPNNHATWTWVVNPTLLNTSWSSASNASKVFAALPANAGTYGAINNQNLSINEPTVGNYVLDINGNVTFNQNNLTLSAPAGSTFLVNIFGDVSLNGGSQGNGFITTGGLLPGNVVYNILGTGTALKTSGGGNAQVIDGTVLAVNGMTQLSPALINGELITYQLQESSGSGIIYMPVPEPAPMALLAMSLGLFGIWRARARKF